VNKRKAVTKARKFRVLEKDMKQIKEKERKRVASEEKNKGPRRANKG